MLVYVLEHCYPYEGCTIVGIFSTRALAEQHREIMISAESGLPSDLTVGEWSVDALVPTLLSPART